MRTSVIPCLSSGLAENDKIMSMFQSCQPSLFSREIPVLEAFSLSPYFKRSLPVFENNQFSNIKVIVYENNMRKNSLFSFTNFLRSA